MKLSYPRSGLMILGAALLGFAVPARLALRCSGFDMDRPGINPEDVARQGPGIILEETFADGDRLLVWAE